MNMNMKSINNFCLSDKNTLSFNESSKYSKGDSCYYHLNKKRSKYAMYSKEVKRQCIEKAKLIDVKEVAAKYSVPLKSLKRWIEIGPDRKKGGGRKVKEPMMEQKLSSWYRSLTEMGFSISPRMIKIKALEYSSNNDFNASKGWLAKFSKKFNLEFYCNKKKRNLDIVDWEIKSEGVKLEENFEKKEEKSIFKVIKANIKSIHRVFKDDFEEFIDVKKENEEDEWGKSSKNKEKLDFIKDESILNTLFLYNNDEDENNNLTMKEVFIEDNFKGKYDLIYKFNNK